MLAPMKRGPRRSHRYAIAAAAAGVADGPDAVSATPVFLDDVAPVPLPGPPPVPERSCCRAVSTRRISIGGTVMCHHTHQPTCPVWGTGANSGL